MLLKRDRIMHIQKFIAGANYTDFIRLPISIYHQEVYIFISLYI